MSSRPRRSAAQRASAAITDLAADREPSGVSSRTRRSLDAREVSSRDRDQSMDRPSSSASADSHHMAATGKGASKLRQSTNGSPITTRNEISVKTRGVPSEPANSKRSTRGTRKRYVESESDEEEDEEEEEEEDEQETIQVGSAQDADGDDDEEMDDLDADGDPDDMDIDAEGEDDEEDADGEPDDDMDESIVVTKPLSRDTRSRAPASRKAAAPAPSRKPPPRKAAAAPVATNDDDDDELSDLDSDVDDPNDDTVMAGGRSGGLGDEDADGDPDDDLDAEGEEIEVATKGADDEDDEEDDEELGSEGDETLDVTKMTKRQRARFEDEPQEYMKLSDEVQVKKVFTAEELSMRRAEMARRRRNLSDKRNEEVKMETINKLLKKQPSKASRRAAAAADEAGEDGEGPRANPLFVRWVSNKDGCHISVPVEIVESPVGSLFAAGTGRKMVQEV